MFKKMFLINAAIMLFLSSSVFAQSGYGLNQGQAFIGVGSRVKDVKIQGRNTTLAGGIGFGDSNKIVGLELDLVITSVDSSERDFAQDGFVSVKLHKALGSLFAIAIGHEGGVAWGLTKDSSATSYVALSKIFLLPDALTISVGVGDGRFLSKDSLKNGDDYEEFASVVYAFDNSHSISLDYAAGEVNADILFAPSKNSPWLFGISHYSGDDKVSASVNYLFNF